MKRNYSILLITICLFITYQKSNYSSAFSVGQTTALQNMSFVIDPGHGGLDNGASVGSVHEAVLNLKIAQTLKAELESRGARVFLTREDDQDMTKRNHHYSKQDDMYLRVKKIDSYQSDFLLSIHLNAAPSASVWGSQVFYYSKSEDGKKLAREIHETMKIVTGSHKSIAGADFRVLRATKTVGVLIECGFISNANERGRLQSSNYHQKLANQICDGIEQYCQKYPESMDKVKKAKSILS